MTLAIPALTAGAVVAPVFAASPALAEDERTRRTAAVAAAPQTRVQHFYGGGVTIRGNKWLQGSGVNVIRSRQCTELATRLYAQKGWGRLHNIYGMRSGRTYDNKLRFHRNGSGYVPVPGDVLVELGGSYQHVAVVNKVTKHAIHTVEQNATASGRHVYRWTGKKAFGAYGPRHVGGFIHSSKNRHTNDPAVKPGKATKPASKPGKHKGKRK